MSKNRDKIRVSFPSASAEQVAGSQVLIQFGKNDEKRTILIECGLIQGESTLLKEYQQNSKKFSFKSRDLDYVFACHMHADHIGLIPRLYKEGCDAPLIVPSKSKAIMKEMLLDSAKIMERDAEDLNKRLKKDYFPIYEIQDVKQTLSHIQEYDRNQKYELSDDISFQFVPSGHIIGSCQLILWIKNNGGIKKIVITSDLGNRSIQQYYIEDFEPIQSANLIVGETTYCNAKRAVTQKDRDKDLEKMKAAVLTTCVDQNGSILLPAFSLQRFQVLLTHLYDLFNESDEDIPDIYAASPLACRISELYEDIIDKKEDREKWEKVKNWEKVHFVSDFESLQNRLNSFKPTIWVASAGMINVGYSNFIAKTLLPRSNNMILFCGFMAPNTIGAKIKERKNKTIAFDGCQIHARCNVMSLNSFTSHMQYYDLLKYYSDYNFDKIALVHGNFSDKVNFSKELQEEISKKNKTGKVTCVNKSTELLI